MGQHADGAGSARRPASVALVQAAHPGPCLAVTTVAVLLAVGAGLDVVTVGVLGGAVLSGQLSIGWCNDLADAARDRAVGRTDKPVASGDVPVEVVRRATVAAVLVCVGASLLLGLPAAAAHLLGVAGGWAYDLVLKRTAWSWAPYAVAFGALPAVPTLAGSPSVLPPWWVPAAGAGLGVAAHLLNAVPDLVDDEATGVRGLPHRLGSRGARRFAVVLLLAVTAVLVGAGGAPWWLLAPALAMAAVALTASGRWPFRAAMLLAVLDVALLVLG